MRRNEGDTSIPPVGWLPAQHNPGLFSGAALPETEGMRRYSMQQLERKYS